jgi:hypothetical protein
MKAYRGTAKASREMIAKVREMPCVECVTCGRWVIVCRLHLQEFICPDCDGGEAVEMPVYVEDPDTPFLYWLYQQRGRHDDIGEFAEAVATRKPLGKPKTWADYMNVLGIAESNPLEDKPPTITPLIIKGFTAIDEYYQTVILDIASGEFLPSAQYAREGVEEGQD